MTSKGPALKGSGKGVAPPPKGVGKGASVEDAPGVKLRPLFWDRIARVPAGSVWEQLVPAVPFDRSVLERHFAAAESKDMGKVSSERRARALDAPKRLRFLDDRTSQKLAIAFSRLPPPRRLATDVDTFEDFPENYPAEAVCALHTAVSEQSATMERLQQLNMSEDDMMQLDMPERYLWALGSVPNGPAKLACAALIMGPAQSLRDVRYAGVVVGTCCRTLRESGLLQRCISTALAVGNCVNQGTSRGGALAIVLPDALLKLDELRGSAQEGTTTLLDFVAHALVEDSRRVGQTPCALCNEVEDLKRRVEAAQVVSLEEGERTCLQICEEVERAWVALEKMPETPGLLRITQKVGLILEESHVAKHLVTAATTELTKTQQWSSAKTPAKSDEWLGGWATFLEQLTQALARAARAFALSSPAAPTSTSTTEVATEEQQLARAVLGSMPIEAPNEQVLASVKPSKEYSLFPKNVPALWGSAEEQENDMNRRRTTRTAMES